MIDLSGRVAIVTGAAGGIGRATAEVLADNGADVVLTDVVPEVTTVAEDMDPSASTLALEVDATDLPAVEAAVAEAVDRFGRIDILANVAGIVSTDPVDVLEKSEWDRVVDVNLDGVFHWTRSVVPIMREQGYGRIVNIASAAGAHIGWQGDFPHYAASKGGVAGFTRSAAIDLGPDGITINAIAPGMIDTNPPGKEVKSDDEYAEAIAQTPVRRKGRPEEIGALIAFLGSDNAAFITGSLVVADGGFTLG